MMDVVYAVYDRHRERRREACAGFAAAARFLAHGEVYEELSAVRIEGRTSRTTFDGRELDDILRPYEAEAEAQLPPEGG